MDRHKQLITLVLITLVLVYTIYYLEYSTTTYNNLPHNSSCCKNETIDGCQEICKDNNRLIGLQIKISNYIQLSYNYNKTLPPDKSSDLVRHSAKKKKGFIIVAKYSEQQMGATMNLLTLCKWAKYVGAQPVEPFVANSEFRLPLNLSQSKLSTILRFKDYFNITYWNKLSSKYGAAQLASWATFLKLMPKKMIFVILLCGKRIKETNFLFVDNQILEDFECNISYKEFITKHKSEVNHVLGLQMVRSVCMKFYGTVLHIDEFNKHIYGEFKASDVVLWINKWTGILDRSRIRIYEKAFHRNTDAFKMILTSERILKDSKMYVEQVIKSRFRNYTAISLRSARRASFLDKSKHFFFKRCIKQLKQTVDFVAGNKSNHKLFLAQDLGRFGDSVADKYMNDDLMESVQSSSFKAVYNGAMNMREWEQSFVSITNGVTDSGYIAAMQSTILKNSKCLIMFGGMSNFQESVLYGYKQNHQNGDSCVYEVCYKPHNKS